MSRKFWNVLFLCYFSMKLTQLLSYKIENGNKQIIFEKLLYQDWLIWFIWIYLVFAEANITLHKNKSAFKINANSIGKINSLGATTYLYNNINVMHARNV